MPRNSESLQVNGLRVRIWALGGAPYNHRVPIVPVLAAPGPHGPRPRSAGSPQSPSSQPRVPIVPVLTAPGSHSPRSPRSPSPQPQVPTVLTAPGPHSPEGPESPSPKAPGPHRPPNPAYRASAAPPCRPRRPGDPCDPSPGPSGATALPDSVLVGPSTTAGLPNQDPGSLPLDANQPRTGCRLALTRAVGMARGR